MFNIIKLRKKHIFLLLVFLLGSFSEQAEAYYVSGAVEFTFSSFQNKVGDSKSSSHTWSENYRVSIANFIYDPRFLRFNAGVGYSVNHTFNAPDVDSVTYSLTTNFFPGRQFSWDLYASRSVVDVPGTSYLLPYNVEATNYGGAAALRLSSLKRGGRRNNNNFNNYNNYNNYNNNNGGRNNGRWSLPPLPDIIVSVDRMEANSLNSARPLEETRDRNKLTLIYHPAPGFDIIFDDSEEKYDNLVQGTGYRHKTMNLNATVNVSRDADLRITGHGDDSETWMQPGEAASHIETWKYDMNLDVRASQRLTHSYLYNFSQLKVDAYELTGQSASGNVRYAYLPEVSLNGTLSYSETEQTTAGSPGSIESRSGQLSTGASYNKEHRLEFLDPFRFLTAYTISAGFTSVEDTSANTMSRGMYYENIVGLGFRSVGWKFETLSLDYSYTSRRDDSPVNGDNTSTSINLAAHSIRVPRTRLDATASYGVTKTQSGSVPAYLISGYPDSKQHVRSLAYSVSASHDATRHLVLDAGARQGHSVSNTEYTLASISGDSERTERQFYGGANFNYNITRFLSFNASGREERTYVVRGVGDDRIVRTGRSVVKYQLRRISLSLEYLWRQDQSDFYPRTTQQQIMARLSRPF